MTKPPTPKALRLPRSDPLEKDIERKVVDHAKQQGLYVRKFVSPNQRSVPDRLFIAPGPRLFFIEFKRKGEGATPNQRSEHTKIRDTGTPVHVVDDARVGKFLVDLYR